MTPFKMIRKIGKVLRGGVTNREMFLGTFFGFFIGMTPGINLTMAIPVVLLLVLNCNTILGILGIVVGKLCCHLLAQYTFAVGYYFIHHLGADSLVRYLADAPVLAYLNWDVYCVIGGLPFAFLGGWLLGWIVTTLITGLQRLLVAGQERSAIMRWIANFFLIRFILWLFFGKRKKSMEDTLETRKGLINFGRVIFFAIIGVAIGIYMTQFRDEHLRRGLEKALGSINTAEVNIEHLSLSLIDGRLIITGLQMTDPAKPENNRVQADQLVLSLNMHELLRKRFVISEIISDSMRMDVPRETPGEVYLSDDKIEELKNKLDEYLDRLAGYLGDLSGADIEQLKRTWERLQNLKEYLEKRGSRKPRERAEADGYLSVSAREVLTEHPAWVIERIEIRNVLVMPELELPSFTIIGRYLSSNPGLMPDDQKASFEIPEHTELGLAIGNRLGLPKDIIDAETVRTVEDKLRGLLK